MTSTEELNSIETDDISVPFNINIDGNVDASVGLTKIHPVRIYSGKRKIESDSSSSGSDSEETDSIGKSVESFKSLSVEDTNETHSETLSKNQTDLYVCKNNTTSVNHLATNSTVHKDDTCDTYLHRLIITQRVKDVLIWLCARSDSQIKRFIDIKNKLGQAPIHLASHAKELDIIEGLLLVGTDLGSQDAEGRTFLHILCENGSIQILNIICVNFELKGFLVEYSGRFIYLTDVPNFDGLTILHLATMRNDVDMVSRLLSVGASVNIGDRKSKRTSLHYAAEAGNTELVNVLLNFSNATDLEARTFNGETPLILAYHRGYDDIVLMLKDKGADFDKAVIKKYGPLRIKVQKRSVLA